jgi:hypothetical protein
MTMSGLKAGTYDVRLVDEQGEVIEDVFGTQITSGMSASAPLKHRVSVDKTMSKPTIATVTLKITPSAKATAASNVRYIIDIVQAGKVKGRPAGFTPITVTAEYLAQNGNRVLIEGLNPNTSYKFTITAVNANGETSDGKARPKDVAVSITAKTAQYTAVQKLKLDKTALPGKGVTVDSAVLTWTTSKALLPAGAVTRYEILWYEGKSKTPTELPSTITADITGTSATLTGLSANMSYKFAIRAVTTVNGVEIPSLVAKIAVKTLKLM